MLEILATFFVGLTLFWIFDKRAHLRWRVRLEILLGITLILGTAAYVIARRFEGGLGAVSNMSDAFPWGIWITFDLCGVALAAGGFVLAGTIHVFNLKSLEPVLRPVVLTALISYQLVAAILVLDLGRPYRFWHPLIMWQPHSVMFEITLCLTLYTVVLIFEFSPVLFEQLRWNRIAHGVHRLALPVVILGVILSTLHQSSFGSLFLIVPNKLSRLWYSPLLPLFFLFSAVSAGIAVVMLESLACSRWIGRGLPKSLLLRLGWACSWVLFAYAGLRIGDLVIRHAWSAGIDYPWLGLAWTAEITLGVLLPAFWMQGMAKRGSFKGLAVTPMLVVGGVILNRLSISWFGLIPGTGYFYVPSWMELVLTAAFVVIGILAFVAAAQVLPVFPQQEASEGHAP